MLYFCFFILLARVVKKARLAVLMALRARQPDAIIAMGQEESTEKAVLGAAAQEEHMIIILMMYWVDLMES